MSLLVAQGLSKTYAGKRDVLALDNVSLELKAGEMVGIVGASGSGKTTLGRSLVGLERPDQGTVCFKGLDIFKINPRPKLQMIVQDAKGSLNPCLTIGQTLIEPLRVLGLLPKKAAEHAAQALLDQVELRFNLKTPVVRLSGGEAQRLVIARALTANPEVLLADEALSQVDVLMRQELLALVLKIQRECHTAVIWISHDRHEVEYLQGRVLTMLEGKLLKTCSC